jgi:hypothetical protein
VLRLVEQAQARARLVSVYEEGDRPSEAFVCDWELGGHGTAAV